MLYGGKLPEVAADASLSGNVEAERSAGSCAARRLDVGEDNASSAATRAETASCAASSTNGLRGCNWFAERWHDYSIFTPASR
jgi:hypothetical protein